MPNQRAGRFGKRAQEPMHGERLFASTVIQIATCQFGPRPKVQRITRNRSGEKWIVAPAVMMDNFSNMKTEYRFRLKVSGDFSDPVTDDQLLDASDALGEAGCDDAAVGVRGGSLDLEFDRAHDSLQDAIVSAVQDVESAGYRVASIEMDRDDAFPVAS